MRNFSSNRKVAAVFGSLALLCGVVSQAAANAVAPWQQAERAGARIGGAAGAAGGSKLVGETLLLVLIGAAAGTAALVVVLDNDDEAASPGS